MRVVISGLSPMALEAARAFAEKGDDVIVIDPDRETFEEVAAELDVAFIAGDAARPDILAQAAPKKVAVMYCLCEDDKDNMIAALVGRAAGIARVVPKIEDRGYHPICDEIGLTERVDPAHAIARALVHMAQDGGGLDQVRLERDTRNDGVPDERSTRPGDEAGDAEATSTR